MKIQEIILFTSDILKQRQFYKNVLEFELLLDTPEKISFKTGESILSFQHKNGVKSTHLAFNIPSNSIYDALKWLKKRTEIISDNDTQISNFSSWKAQAIYFYDADNNIIEFIARGSVGKGIDADFSSQSILSISEIAIATKDIESRYIEINEIKPIQIFDGSFERFCVLGDDEGLFILVNKAIKKWCPVNDDVFTSDFIIKGDYNFSFIDGEIKELS